MWAAAGDVTLSGDDIRQRLVVPASPLWFMAGAVVGVALSAFRRSGACVWPTLLSILPWLPVPLPAVCLLWTGPLAWVPVGVAIVSALVSGRRARAITAAPRPGLVATSAVAAGLATLAATALVLHSVGARLPGGDEPHYLIIAQSLLQDGDLRIENNHANRDYAAYWGAGLEPHFFQRGQDGEIYSIHAPGVAVLVAPLFALFGLAGAQWTVMALAAVGGALIWLAGWEASRRLAPAWFAWAAVAGSVTMLVQSVMIFPDGPGAVAVAAAALLWLRLERGERVPVAALVAVSALLAALPFLHTRFVILSVGLGLVIASRLGTEADPRTRARRLAVFFVLPAIGAIAWFGYFHVIYGTPNPTIPYGASDDSRLAYAPGGLLGLLFDQQFGLFSYSPVLALAWFGWVGARQRGDARRWPLAAVALVYLAAVCMYWMWWAGGPATPARLATGVLPLLAPPLAVVWRDSGAMRRTVAAVLLTASLATSALVLGIGSGDLAWSVRDAQAAWLWAAGPVVDLPRAWPSFFWQLIGGDVASEWPFVLHVSTWLLVAALAASVAWAAVRGRGDRERAVAAGALALLFGSMAAVQAGWWLNGVSGVRPAPSQLTVLCRAVDGAAVYAVASWRVRRVHDDPLPVTITVPRIDLPVVPEVAWAGLRDVPAGTYDVEFSVPRPAGGTLTVRTGAAPLDVVSLPHRSRHAWTMVLPSAVADLRFEPDAAVASSDGTLRLTRRLRAPSAAASDGIQ